MSIPLIRYLLLINKEPLLHGFYVSSHVHLIADSHTLVRPINYKISRKNELKILMKYQLMHSK